MKIGNYELENDRECKRIANGWEIFPDAVEAQDLTPEDFKNAHWEDGSIIVED